MCVEDMCPFLCRRFPGFFVSVCVRVSGRLEFELRVSVHRESLSVVIKSNGSSPIR